MTLFCFLGDLIFCTEHLSWSLIPKIKPALWTWPPSTSVVNFLIFQTFLFHYRYVLTVNWSPSSQLPACLSGYSPGFLSIAQPRICHCACVLEVPIFAEIWLRLYLSLTYYLFIQVSVSWFLSCTRGQVKSSQESFVLSTTPMLFWTDMIYRCHNKNDRSVYDGR